MTVIRGFVIVILSGLVFGGAGACIGWLLAVLAPDFYRAIFRMPPGSAIDPVQVGVGVGLVNGVMIGLGLGTIIVIITTWWNVRMISRRFGSPPADR